MVTMTALASRFGPLLAKRNALGSVHPSAPPASGGPKREVAASRSIFNSIAEISELGG